MANCIAIRMVCPLHEAVVKAVEKVKTMPHVMSCQVQDNYGDVRLQINYTEDISKKEYDEVLKTCMELLHDFVYSLDDMSLAQTLFQLLTLRHKKIAVAESFTGGGIAKRLVEVPGVSSVYYEGINCYSNESKMERLGVRAESLRLFGAVSDEVAYQMAGGLIAQGHCDISIASTGLAGPQSDDSEKPVGLCYLAIGVKDNVYVYKYILKGDRQTITETAINKALFLAYQHLK